MNRGARVRRALAALETAADELRALQIELDVDPLPPAPRNTAAGRIEDWIATHPGDFGATDIADSLAINPITIRATLHRLTEGGVIERVRHGQYRAAGHDPSLGETTAAT